MSSRRNKNHPTCSGCHGARAESTYLCSTCVVLLEQMLGEVGWLWDQLQVTRRRADRLPAEVGGKGAGQPSPINVDAMQLSETVADDMGRWVQKLVDENQLRFFPPLSVGCNFIGPLLPGWQRLPRGYSGSVKQHANWLAHHAKTAAGRPDVHELFALLVRYVGNPDRPSAAGEMLRLINRPDRLFAGECPGLVYRNGEGVVCERPLWCFKGEKTTECTRCNTVVDVARNRLAAYSGPNNLLPRARLAEVLDSLGEHVPHMKLAGWVASGQLKCQGYQHRGEFLEVGDPNIRPRDPALFSLSKARILLSEEQRAQEQEAG